MDLGTCPSCGRSRAVRLDGRLAVHRNWPTLRRESLDCPGSGQYPRGESKAVESDAEARGYQKAIDALRNEAARSLERITEARADSAMWDMYDSAADWLETVREDHAPAPTVHEGETAP